jgi:hypothetical protein
MTALPLPQACRITVGRLHVNYHWQRRLTFQGHILAGTIKDIVTRYAHQTGHHVTRRFGWDCHGLPIEFEIDRDLGVRTRDQVLALGVDKYNEACRGIVMRYSKGPLSLSLSLSLNTSLFQARCPV